MKSRGDCRHFNTVDGLYTTCLQLISGTLRFNRAPLGLFVEPMLPGDWVGLGANLGRDLFVWVSGAVRLDTAWC